MTLTMTYTGSAGRWTGVLRDGKDVVVECGHRHANRDTGANAAMRCIENLLFATRRVWFEQRLLADEAQREVRARKLGARVEDGAFTQEARLRIARAAAAIEGREVRRGKTVCLTEDGRVFNQYGLELPGHNS